ncbi:MAG: sugar transferase [Planctomycetaceae bacterium]|nr:sugar transferase [Planctomycetaceae bacterium]
MLKRLFDVVAAGMGLILISPFMMVAAIAVRWSSPGPVFFRQERMGRGGKPFFIMKFRTMVQDSPKLGGQITVGDDPRITKVGRLLRKTKLDELPQLLNVLKGDMSMVGPRPEVRKYVEMFADDYREILRVRPGVTDLASLKYRDESTVLAQAADPDQEYIRRVLPEKIQYAREYIRRRSFWLDMKIIFATIFQLLADRMPSRLSEKSKTT